MFWNNFSFPNSKNILYGVLPYSCHLALARTIKGRKVYMFQYLLSTVALDFMEFLWDDRCHGWKLWMRKLSSELRLTVTCHLWWTVNLPWHVVICTLNALLWSLSSPRDTFFCDRSDPEGRRYQTKEAKRKKRKKKKKKGTSYMTDPRFSDERYS